MREIDISRFIFFERSNDFQQIREAHLERKPHQPRAGEGSWVPQERLESLYEYRSNSRKPNRDTRFTRGGNPDQFWSLNFAKSAELTEGENATSPVTSACFPDTPTTLKTAYKVLVHVKNTGGGGDDTFLSEICVWTRPSFAKSAKTIVLESPTSPGHEILFEGRKTSEMEDLESYLEDKKN